MDESSGASIPAGDAELLNTIRSGDPGAFAVLRARHETAARALAVRLAGQDAADDIVAGALGQVLDAITRGGGPTDAFRPYLLTAVRRAAGDGGGLVPVDDQQIPDPGQPLRNPRAEAAAPVIAAFLSLPERWQAVLWHVEVERTPAAEVTALLGLSAAEVGELAGWARDALARAGEQLHPGPGGDPAGPADAGGALREAVAPVFLGAAAAGYLADLGGHAGSATPGAATAPAAGLAWAADRLRRTSSRQRTVAAGAAAVLVLLGAAAFVLTPSPTTRTDAAAGHRKAAGQPSPRGSGAASPTATSPTATSPAGTPRPSVSATPTTPAPAPTATPPATPNQPPSTPPTTAPPSPSPRPTPRPTPTRPAPTARVSAEISVFGPGRFSPTAAVVFGITDGGPAATSELSARISLPAGAAAAAGWHSAPAAAVAGQTAALSSRLDWSGWSCQPVSGGAQCSHGPISAAMRTGGWLAVRVSGSSACGQHVQVTVTGGTSPASAESLGTIQCERSWSPATTTARHAARHAAQRPGRRPAGHRPGPASPRPPWPGGPWPDPRGRWHHGHIWRHSGWPGHGRHWAQQHWPGS